MMVAVHSCAIALHPMHCCSFNVYPAKCARHGNVAKMLRPPNFCAWQVDDQDVIKARWLRQG